MKRHLALATLLVATARIASADKGYRQDTERNGNPLAALLVVLSSPGAGGRLTVIRISGDRARAEALLAATRQH